MQQQYKFFEMGTYKNVAHVDNKGARDYKNKCETLNHATRQ